MFNSQAQTPTCIIFAKKSSPINNNEYKCEKTKTIPIYDTINKTIVPFNLKQGKAIPTCGVRILNKLQMLVEKYGSIIDFVTKTSMPSIKISVSN